MASGIGGRQDFRKVTIELLENIYTKSIREHRNQYAYSLYKSSVE